MTSKELKKQLLKICPDGIFTIRKGRGTVFGSTQITFNYGSSLRESFQKASEIHDFCQKLGVRYSLSIGTKR